MASTLSNAQARLSALQMAQVWQRLATDIPISPTDPRHRLAVGKSSRSLNSNSRSNPRTPTRRNEPPASARGG